MIIKENGRLFIALPPRYTLEDIGVFQTSFLNVLASLDKKMINVEELRGLIQFSQHLFFDSSQLFHLGLGEPDKALEAKSQ